MSSYHRLWNLKESSRVSQRDLLTVWIAVVRPESAKLTPADSASIPLSRPLYGMIETQRNWPSFRD
jgi:hypothetical protein